MVEKIHAADSEMQGKRADRLSRVYSNDAPEQTFRAHVRTRTLTIGGFSRAIVRGQRKEKTLR
jgi:hypothetical protein